MGEGEEHATPTVQPTVDDRIKEILARSTGPRNEQFNTKTLTVVRDEKLWSAEVGEASNRWKVYFEPTEPEEVKMDRLDEVKRLQDYALSIGAASVPKPRPTKQAEPVKEGAAHAQEDRQA